MSIHRPTKKGRVFYSYLISYALILLIPVIMSFFLFNRASTILTAEAERANDLLLNQIKTYFDMVMSEVTQLRYLAAYNDRMEGLLYARQPVDADDYYRAYQVVNNFRVYKFATSSIEDFYVYASGLDMVLSPGGYFTSRNFYQAWMTGLGTGYREWLDRFTGARRVVYTQGTIQTSRNVAMDTIEIIYPLPASNQTGVPRGWLVVHIDARMFTRVLDNTTWTDESVVLVLDEEFGVVASSTTEAFEELESGFVDWSGSLRTVRIGGTTYVAVSERSDVVDWSYVSLVPLDIYDDRFVDLSRFTVLAFLFCIVVGGIVMYRLAIVRYRPVYGLLELLSTESNNSISIRSDEFAMITASLKMTLAEDELLRQKVQKSQPIVAQRYLQQILKGRIRDGDEARSELIELGVSFERRYLTVVLLDIELKPDAGPRVREKCVRDLWSGEYPAQTLRDIDGAVGFIVNHSDPSTDGIEARMRRAKRAMESRYPALWSIGISETKEVDGDLHELYRTARRALDFRLVKGREEPILYTDIRASNQSYYYPMEQETKLINSIKTGDAETAASIVEEVYARNFADTPLSLEMARCLMFDLIATMIKSVNSVVGREEDGAFWSRVKPINRLTACTSLDQLKMGIDSTLNQTCSYVREHRTSHAEQLRRDILAQIHDRYADPNLCTDALADTFDRSSQYLARFFREQMSIGVSTYIKRYRLEAAKRILRAESTTLDELAHRVGFAGSNALIRAFKDVEGITPGRFRESTAT